MTLGLAVVRHGDEQLANPVRVSLGARCRIGRGRDCDVVLEDPTRHVSREHAAISRQGDAYILSVSSKLNPVILNGRPVTSGQQAQLGNGDVLIIGEYEINVVAEEADSLGALLGGTAPPVGGGLDDIFGSLPARGAPAPAPGPGAGRIDELLTPPPSSVGAVDPLADLLGGAGAPASRAADSASDPLLSLLGDSGSRASAPVTPSSDLGRALGPSEGVSSIDELLGGAASIQSDPLGLGLLGQERQSHPGYIGGNSRGASPQLDHVHDVNLPVSLPEIRGPGDAAPPPPRRPATPAADANVDPLAALLGGAGPAGGPAPGGDPLASLFGDAPAPSAPVAPPAPAAPVARAAPSAPPVAPPPPRAAPPEPAAAEDPLAALLGRAMEPGEPGDPSLLFASTPPAPAPAPVAKEPKSQQQFVETTVFSIDENVPTSRATHIPSPPAAPQESAAPASAPPAASGPSAQAAIEAFLAGAGMQGVQIPPGQVDAFLQECGATVRAAVEGIMGMLLARAKVREELRASDRTMVASRENNALKLIESVDEALKYVFDPATRADDAFLPPPKAVADACNDLQAHEIALVAGMRAALMGSIKKFEPSIIEKKLEKEGGKSLLANKKAQLWDRFVTYQDDLAKDAEDNFDRVFGSDFLRTYTEQVKRLRR